jgi:hypothetical protein
MQATSLSLAPAPPVAAGSNNRTFSHIIRINSWQPNSDKLAEYLANSPSSVNKQSVRNTEDESTSTSTTGGSRCTTELLLRRQVDPLHSCIEAKCSSWNSGNYLDCIYRHCINSLQGHGRRSATAEAVAKRDDVDDSFGRPEGRFLLLPVSIQRPSEPQPLPDLLLTSPPAAAPGLRRDVGNSEAAGDDDVQQLERATASATDKDNRGAALRAKRSVEGSSVGSIWNDLRAAKRAKYDVTRNVLNSSSTKSSFGVGGNSKSGLQQHHPRGAAAAALNPSVRSYNDIADVCVEHHCGLLQPHSLSYFRCVEHHCTGRK